MLNLSANLANSFLAEKYPELLDLPRPLTKDVLKPHYLNQDELSYEVEHALYDEGDELMDDVVCTQANLFGYKGRLLMNGSDFDGTIDISGHETMKDIVEAYDSDINNKSIPNMDFVYKESPYSFAFSSVYDLLYHEEYYKFTKGKVLCSKGDREKISLLAKEKLDKALDDFGRDTLLVHVIDYDGLSYYRFLVFYESKALNVMIDDIVDIMELVIDNHENKDFVYCGTKVSYYME